MPVDNRALTVLLLALIRVLDSNEQFSDHDLLRELAIIQNSSDPRLKAAARQAQKLAETALNSPDSWRV